MIGFPGLPRRTPVFSQASRARLGRAWERPNGAQGQLMNDRQFPARAILAVSAAGVSRGQGAYAGRARARSSPFQPAWDGVEGGEAWPSRSPKSAWKRSRSRPSSSRSIAHEGERARTHFVIASFVARWTSGKPRLSDEVDAVDWIDPAASCPRRRRRRWRKFSQARRGLKGTAREGDVG